MFRLHKEEYNTGKFFIYSKYVFNLTAVIFSILVFFFKYIIIIVPYFIIYIISIAN